MSKLNDAVTAARRDAFTAGRAARDKEVEALRNDLDNLRASTADLAPRLQAVRAELADLTAAVAKAQAERVRAERALSALTGRKPGADADGAGDFLALQTRFGHVEARRRFPGEYAKYMQTHGGPRRAGEART